MNRRVLTLSVLLASIALLILLLIAEHVFSTVGSQDPVVDMDASNPKSFDAAMGELAKTPGDPFDTTLAGLVSVLSTPSVPFRIQSPSGGDWQIETVTSDEGFGWYSSLALDSSGNPHISYVDITLPRPLKYARKNGGAWDIQTVRTGAGIRVTSLVLDSNDYARISYYTVAGDRLMYLRWTGSAWDAQEVEEDHIHGQYTSLALDAEGNPHISYNGAGMAELRYAHWTGSLWDIQTVDGKTYDISLALDSQGHPHISYCADGNLKYARWTGSNWLVQTVDEAYPACSIILNVGSTSLALDIEDNAHVAYSNDYPNGDLKYARWTGSAWEIQTITEGSNPSLVLDAEDRPHIAYERNSGVHYARLVASEWLIQSVAYGGFPSLALDSRGYPHISFAGSGLDVLKYARFIPYLLTLDKQATPSDGLRHGRTVTYSLTLSGADSGLQLWDPLPPTLNYVEGSVTPPAAYEPDARAVIWEGVLPETPLIFQFQARLNVADAKPPSWPLPIVNTAWLTDTEWGRVISASAAVSALPTPLTLDKRATPSDGVLNVDTVTYTLTLSSADFSVRLWDPLPGNVQYVSGTLTGTVTPSAVYSPTSRAVMWEGTLPKTLKQIRFQITPVVTGRSTLSLALPIVNTAWLTETESGVGVSATFIVNGYRMKLPLILKEW